MLSTILNKVGRFTIKDGILNLPMLSDDEVNELSIELRNAILDDRVAMYKPIGVHISANGNTTGIDYVTKLRGVGKSYVEIARELDNLVYADTSGEINTSEVFGELKDSGCGFLFGIGKVTSSNMGLNYVGEGRTSCPTALVPNVNIGSFTDGCTINLIIKRGTGVFDYEEAMEYLDGTGYKPLRTYYTLTDYVSVSIHNQGEKFIKFNYKTQLNEEVLSKLLNDYLSVYSY